MSFFKITINIFVLSCVFLGAACSKPKVSYHYPNHREVDRRSKNTGRFMSGNWKPLEGDKKEAKEQTQDVSRLWQTSVQVVGLLFPISIIDEKSGIIATEWYQENEKSNIRIKINVLVRSKKRLEDSVRVSVFEQKRKDENSPWQAGAKDPKSVARSALKAQKIQDEILRRLKQDKSVKEKNKADE